MVVLLAVLAASIVGSPLIDLVTAGSDARPSPAANCTTELRPSTIAPAGAPTRACK
jgi:hypothetical protein